MKKGLNSNKNDGEERKSLNKRRILKERNENIPEKMMREEKEVCNEEILEQGKEKKYAKVIKGLNN